MTQHEDLFRGIFGAIYSRGKKGEEKIEWMAEKSLSFCQSSHSERKEAAIKIWVSFRKVTIPGIHKYFKGLCDPYDALTLAGWIKKRRMNVL